MRDLGLVLDFLLKNVIPETEESMREKLSGLSHKILYTPPELQRNDWLEFCQILSSFGQPNGVVWKERMARIVRDEEKIHEPTN